MLEKVQAHHILIVFGGQSGSTKGGILSRALQRYRGWTLGNTDAAQLPELTGLAVICDGTADDCGDGSALDEDTDESYELVILAPGAGQSTLRASSVWGLLRGLETFSQMVEFRPTPGGWSSDRYIRAVPVRIVDYARWSYRGLLIDTARHFLPLSVLRQHIDAMAWSKVNVFHWHHYDANSFSLVSESVPALANAATAPGWQYSHTEVSDLVQYARDRGVRVIAEFETPGHCNALYKAVPMMATVCYADNAKHDPLQGEMNPCSNVAEQVVFRIPSTLQRRSCPPWRR